MAYTYTYPDNVPLEIIEAMTLEQHRKAADAANDAYEQARSIKGDVYGAYFTVYGETLIRLVGEAEGGNGGE